MVYLSHLCEEAELMLYPYIYRQPKISRSFMAPTYVKVAMECDPSLVMQYRSFVDVWHKWIPENKFMAPCTDLCALCE